jgi:hypothetical protein
MDFSAKLRIRTCLAVFTTSCCSYCTYQYQLGSTDLRYRRHLPSPTGLARATKLDLGSAQQTRESQEWLLARE